MVATLLTRESFRDLIAAGPAVVLFTAPWCPPGRRLEPVLDRLAERYAGRVGFGKVSADDLPGLVWDNGVLHLPQTLLFASSEEPVARLASAESEDEVAEAIDRHLFAAG